MVALSAAIGLIGALIGARPAVAVRTPPGADPKDRLAAHEELTVKGSHVSSQIAENFDVLGHQNLGGGAPNGDVFFYDHGGDVGKFAYVGTWSGPCSGTGVKVIDVNDPTKPKVVAYAAKQNGVSTEDMVVRRIGDRDVLATGVQVCKAGHAGGVQLVDVTDPSHPVDLGFLPVASGGVHELDLVVRPDGQALALLAVPFVEFGNTYFGDDAGGEFRVVDVTDPANPVELSNWGVIADSSLPIVGGNDEVSSSFQGIGSFAAYFDHSVRAADDGMTAYVSYWDGGVLKFDITDPSNPQLLARTTYPIDADGDAHSMTFLDAQGDRFIFQNDEDFGPFGPTVVTTSATGDTEYAAIEEPWMPTLLSELGGLSGEVFDAGDGCQASDFTGSAGKIALADTVDPFYVGIIPGWTVPCSFGAQVLNAVDAGASAFLSNLVSPDDAYPFAPSSKDLKEIQKEAGDMVVVQISDIDELADAIRGGGAGVTASLTPAPPSWGFIRIFAESTGHDDDGDGVLEYDQVGQFSDLPHVTGELFPPPGDWSVHNTELSGDHAYSSWYTNGVVSLDLSDPAAPELVGQFVPSTKSCRGGVLGPGPALIWGVAIDPDTGIVYASEMRCQGLWILQPTGPAAPAS